MFSITTDLFKFHTPMHLNRGHDEIKICNFSQSKKIVDAQLLVYASQSTIAKYSSLEHLSHLS